MFRPFKVTMSQTKFPIFPIPNLRTLEARILEVLLDLPSHLRIPYCHIYLFSKCCLFCFPKYSSIRFPFCFGNNKYISFLSFFFLVLTTYNASSPAPHQTSFSPVTICNKPNYTTIKCKVLHELPTM